MPNAKYSIKNTIVEKDSPTTMFGEEWERWLEEFARQVNEADYRREEADHNPED
jgi:hypothetical protein